MAVIKQEADQPLLAHHMPDSVLVPLHTFPVEDEFIWRHEQGTMIEMQNEELVLRILNEEARPFKCWVITAIPSTTTAFHKSWLFLVQPPECGEGNMFPSITDHFRIDMLSTVKREDGEYSLVHLPTSRIPNPFEAVERVRDARVRTYAAFKVDVPRSWKNSDGDHVEVDLVAGFRIASTMENPAEVCLEHNDHQLITVEWDVQSTTFEAELSALRYLTNNKQAKGKGPSFKSRQAFKMIQDYHTCWKTYYDLHQDFPQLRNPTHTSHRIPTAVLKRFQSFNQDHLRSFSGLQKIPNGLYFVNGCPGSGKTEWNMVLAAIIQTKSRVRRRPNGGRILFLVDINRTVDDAANRYFALCREAGLDLRIVRMHGWPREMRESSKLQGPRGKKEQGANEPSETDFTDRFLTVAGLSKQTQLSKNSAVVPTLDEASWQYFEDNKKDAFPDLLTLLNKMDSGETLTVDNWKALRRHVAKLYRAVLARTDFIATTPVAAYGRGFSKFFKPDLVFVDEASHARELTTLIPLAYFSPKAWIFTGDVKQTQPFVQNAKKNNDAHAGIKFNPFAAQLKLSTMARVDHVDAVNSKLLVNRRAFANLHRLPSQLFYNGEMISGYVGADLYPRSVAHLKNFLQNVSGVEDIDENRIIINLQASQEKRQRDSFWNPIHHDWVLAQTACLLKDDQFRGLRTESERGTIMILTPYSTAVKQYEVAVKTWPEEWQERVQVLTVDRAQGNESDVVFLDLVRTQTAGFMDDPRRLNVSITRARQAELILMRPAMAYMLHGRERIRRSKFLSKLWEDTMFHKRLVNI
ncbi:hypothetical protein QQS21_002784 [Conoideocrella luteorostrata]|uniref:Uncharacterized protein n=1 Tax=Conoideocrella luteorostrata TaxID=1105319 RepID=A0AAJ0FWZ0_9HYPO|nr:hypothetical protein QQS21_002784 [Conoideocrella luteorostrata]